MRSSFFIISCRIIFEQQKKNKNDIVHLFDSVLVVLLLLLRLLSSLFKRFLFSILQNSKFSILQNENFDIWNFPFLGSLQKSFEFIHSPSLLCKQKIFAHIHYLTQNTHWKHQLTKGKSVSVWRIPLIQLLNKWDRICIWFEEAIHELIWIDISASTLFALNFISLNLSASDSLNFKIFDLKGTCLRI